MFNRDGMYVANMMQKAGRPDLSEAVIDFFLHSPFNGRPFPEADNPGQVLWILRPLALPVVSLRAGAGSRAIQGCR